MKLLGAYSVFLSSQANAKVVAPHVAAAVFAEPGTSRIGLSLNRSFGGKSPFSLKGIRWKYIKGANRGVWKCHLQKTVVSHAFSDR